jgi:hypothetical protein
MRAIALAFLALQQAEPPRVFPVERSPADVQKAYQKAAEEFARARGFFEKGELDEALDPLNTVLLTPSKVKEFECVLRIEQLAQDYKPFEFYPFQLRGRVHLAKGARSGRKHLWLAIDDLEASAVAHKCSESVPFLNEARKALWTSLRGALAFETWDAGQAGLEDELRNFLGRGGDPGPVASWISEQAAVAAGRLRLLRPDPEDSAGRQQAARAERWCALVEKAAAGLRGLERADLARLRADAARIANFRGTFLLKVAAHPYARFKLVREGTGVAEEHTPWVVPQALEIGEFEATFDHPQWKGRKWSFGRAQLGHGKTFILRGDMATGKFSLDELPE